MNSTRKSVFGMLLVAALGLAAAAPGRQQPGQPARQPGQPAPPQPPDAPQDDAQARIRATSNLVVIPVTVKDSSGRVVLDIRREEFRIFEDDVEQQLEVFSNEPFPLSVVVLLDNDLDTKVAEQVEPTFPALVAGISQGDEVYVARFDQTFKEAKGFTTDPDQLLTQLKRTHVQSSPARAPAGGPMGTGPTINGAPAPGVPPTSSPTVTILKAKPTKNVDDAIFAAAGILKGRARERRKIILLVSDGVNSHNNRVTFKDAVRALLTAGVTVYSVGVGDAFLNRGIPVVSKVTATPLSKYARATAGDVFYAAKRSEIEEHYATALEEARVQYTLAYVPRGTDRTKDYHSIEVRVRRPGLTVDARDGYYTSEVPH
ncbi:MAG TPA: VWA domain-containing protein [Methylomirabilota bacterium]|nr:VWA domain-containing protein [Methylomirabilota bacterium]